MTCLTTEDLTGSTKIAVLATVTGVTVATSYNSSIMPSKIAFQIQIEKYLDQDSKKSSI